MTERSVFKRLGDIAEDILDIVGLGKRVFDEASDMLDKDGKKKMKDRVVKEVDSRADTIRANRKLTDGK